MLTAIVEMKSIANNYTASNLAKFVRIALLSAFSTVVSQVEISVPR